MRNPDLTRRRMIAIAATVAGSAFLTGGRTAQAGDAVRWRGSALGAQVSIEIYHPDRAEAERLVERCVLDVRRLERQFSLYRPDSAICTLNRTGILVSPDADMVALLEASLLFADLTDSAFDPTVQPLWQLYADHFSSERSDPEGPSPQRLAAALVGRSGLLVSADRVALVKRGAAITLNGIAQGYATDTSLRAPGSPRSSALPLITAQRCSVWTSGRVSRYAPDASDRLLIVGATDRAVDLPVARSIGKGVVTRSGKGSAGEIERCRVPNGDSVSRWRFDVSHVACFNTYSGKVGALVDKDAGCKV